MRDYYAALPYCTTILIIRQCRCMDVIFLLAYHSYGTAHTQRHAHSCTWVVYLRARGISSGCEHESFNPWVGVISLVSTNYFTREHDLFWPCVLISPASMGCITRKNYCSASAFSCENIIPAYIERLTLCNKSNSSMCIHVNE